jgi:hypothetical protein
LDQPDNAQDSHYANKPSQPTCYEIRIQGQLDSTWSDWFDGMEVTPQENGETVLTGSIAGQAALFSILLKLFNLGLPLLGVRRVSGF